MFIKPTYFVKCYLFPRWMKQMWRHCSTIPVTSAQNLSSLKAMSLSFLILWKMGQSNLLHLKPLPYEHFTPSLNPTLKHAGGCDSNIKVSPVMLRACCMLLQRSLSTFLCVAENGHIGLAHVSYLKHHGAHNNNKLSNEFLDMDPPVRICRL